MRRSAEILFSRFPNKRAKRLGDDEPDDPRGLWEEDLPTVEPPYVTQLKRSKGGPYYLTPDSAEPLPSGMWSNLDPDTVQEESERMTRLLGGEWQMGVVQPALRESLEGEGPLGRRIIEALEGPRPQTSRVSPAKRPK